MSRLRWRTFAMSVLTAPVIVPKCAAWCTKCATLALQISFLLGRQAMFGQDPPIHRRSIRDVLKPDHSFTDLLRVGIEIDRKPIPKAA
jgi:hypothetical protein